MFFVTVSGAFIALLIALSLGPETALAPTLLLLAAPAYAAYVTVHAQQRLLPALDARLTRHYGLTPALQLVAPGGTVLWSDDAQRLGPAHRKLRGIQGATKLGLATLILGGLSATLYWGALLSAAV